MANAAANDSDKYEKSIDAEEAIAEYVGNISQLVGKWFWSRSGSTTWSTSGTYAGGNGSRFTYQFSPNGTVEFTGIMNVMMGGCSQQVFNAKTGKASLSGNTLTIRWSPTKFTRDFSCDRANNYTKTLPAETETSQINFKDSDGQKQLCLIGKDETLLQSGKIIERNVSFEKRFVNFTFLRSTILRLSLGRVYCSRKTKKDK